MRTPACSTSATGSPSPSRPRATTTPRRSSRSRAPPPASAASSATSSRWAPGRSRFSTACASARPNDHFSRAVGGIGAYGNSVGVPNVGGEVVFDDVYASNCLVNAMCVGLLPADSVMSARADTAGALLVLYGATTGRDGIGGASVLASQELGEEAADKRPSVQVGDPFTGQAPDRGVGRARRARARALAPGLRRRRPRLVALRDGRRLRHRRPPRPRAPARGRDGAVGGHDLRVAGADGGDRRARAARRGGGGDRPLGAASRRDRRGDRDRRAAGAVAR